MKKNHKQTSERMARLAAKTLRNIRASKLNKSLSGSVLSQAKGSRMRFLGDVRKRQIFLLSDFQ
ncbi:MAG TPA: hypothetical protein VK211_25545 [Kamptonema sp.]|nr:hypothetical protein [Kamptonema sp.]